MITCYTVTPKCPECGLNPQMWINVVEYHDHIYNIMKHLSKSIIGYFEHLDNGIILAIAMSTLGTKGRRDYR